jgi:hypothetical protein
LLLNDLQAGELVEQASSATDIAAICVNGHFAVWPSTIIRAEHLCQSDDALPNLLALQLIFHPCVPTKGANGPSTGRTHIRHHLRSTAWHVIEARALTSRYTDAWPLICLVYALVIVQGGRAGFMNHNVSLTSTVFLDQPVE